MSILNNSEIQKITYKTKQKMQDYTTMKVGGEVEYMFFPSTKEELYVLLSECQKNNLKYFILGKGSNLVVNDEGLDLIVINIANFNAITLDENDSSLIHAESGANLSDLSSFAVKHSLTGLEFASGIPGTVGGAVFMNAGAYGGEIKDVLENSEIFTDKLEVINNQEHSFGYRKSSIAERNAVIFTSTFRLKQANADEIQATIDELTEQRSSKQPLEMSSAGSTFKRPEGYFAGKLITDAGLKGFRLGGAVVSDKHAGFIINQYQAKAQDILDLIAHVQTTVQDKFGVYLEPEVKFLEKDGTFRDFSKK